MGGHPGRRPSGGRRSPLLSTCGRGHPEGAVGLQELLPRCGKGAARFAPKSCKADVCSLQLFFSIVAWLLLCGVEEWATGITQD